VVWGFGDLSDKKKGRLLREGKEQGTALTEAGTIQRKRQKIGRVRRGNGKKPI